MLGERRVCIVENAFDKLIMRASKLLSSGCGCVGSSLWNWAGFRPVCTLCFGAVEVEPMFVLDGDAVVGRAESESVRDSAARTKQGPESCFEILTP